MQNGITLIALVISIIVMLILAGVSINAIVGDDGIISQVTNAKLVSEEAVRRESLDMILLDYNSSEFLGEAEGMHKFLSKIQGEGQIGNYALTTDEDYAIIKYGDKNYEIVRESEGSTYYKISEEVDGSILEDGDNFILTQKTLDTEDGFVFENGKSYIVLDEKLTADEFDFNIQAGDPVTIKIMHDMDIDNKDVPNRSAINLENGATLNLYIYGKVNVNSSYGVAGTTSDANNETFAEGGDGASAGIHVGEGSVLNLYGTGILIAIGGDAGEGGGTSNARKGGGGGGGAGAGIGGNGGKGGDGNSNTGLIQGASGYNTGFHGKEGENCGTVNIYNTLTVYAYGGGGGAGGVSSASSGGGGGGYPAAGIGGGGAGGGAGDHISGGGGYTGGNEQTALEKPNNGEAGNTSDIESEMICDFGPGGGYFKEAKDDPRPSSVPLDMYGGLLGGGGGWTSNREWGYTYGGDGGIAGKGGKVTISSEANIKAFNGNKYTDGTSYNNGENAVEIYAQKGKLLKIEKTLGWWDDEMNNYYSKMLGITVNYTRCWDRNKNEKVLLRPEGTCSVLSYGQGIGSGAGYIEVSNGTYTVDSSMN